MEDLAPRNVYTAPPIIEAAVELIFQASLSDSNLRKLVSKLRRGYDALSEQEAVNANVDFQNRTARFEAEPLKRFYSADETDSLVLKRASLLWSRLSPYKGWIPFLERIQRDFEIVHEIAGPRKLSRIGVRYVNRLDIPRDENVVRYEDYLAINIALPKKIDVIQNYAWRFEREFVDEGALAIVQSAIVQPEVPNTGAFILDIDVVALHSLPLKVGDVFSKLERLRNIKNELFEISITDKARESFLT